jgi:hypothetical protein
VNQAMSSCVSSELKQKARFFNKNETK